MDITYTSEGSLVRIIYYVKVMMSLDDVAGDQITIFSKVELAEGDVCRHVSMQL